MLTRSPSSSPRSLPPGPTETSPVMTPTLALRPEMPRRSPIEVTLSTSSREARTARSASSSFVVVAPHQAITASPMYLSTVPPNRSTTLRARSK